MNTTNAFHAAGRSSWQRTVRSCPAPGRGRFRLAPVAAVCAALCSLGAQAQVQLPTLLPGGQIIGANVPPATGSTLTITQTQTRGVIEWSNFNIGTGGTVNINQPGADSVLLNRVLNNPNGSRIDGALNANGRVFVLDPGGITFGAGAQVSVGSLIAAAMDLRGGAEGYNAFVNQGLMSLDTTNPFGRVVVEPGASLGTRAVGGEIGLLAPALVDVQGGISAPSGRVVLAGAGGADIAVGTSGFVTFRLNPAQPVAGAGYTPPQVNVSGGVVADNGEVGLTVRGVESNIEGIVRPRIVVQGQATLQANGTLPVVDGGRVLIDADANGEVTINGQINAGAVDGVGGTIAAVGHTVRVSGSFVGEIGTTSIQASGQRGGGTVRLGDANTRSLVVDGFAQVLANALVGGDGGTIELMADYRDKAPQQPPTPRETFGVADLYGLFSASGGPEGGDGGSIQVRAQGLTTTARDESGAIGSFVAGALSPTGRPGTFLLQGPQVSVQAGIVLDPNFPNVQIEDVRLNSVLDSGANVTLVATDPLGPFGTAQLLTGAVIRRTQGTVPLTFTMQADRDVIIDGGTTIASNAGPLNVRLLSNRQDQGGSVFVNGNLETANEIRTAGGSVVLGGGANPATGFAQGTAGSTGVSLRVTNIDTTDGAGAGGNVIVRGIGFDSEGAGDGIFMEGGSIAAGTGSITLVGHAESGAGIRLQSLGAPNPPVLLQASGGITLRGTAESLFGGFGNQAPTGVSAQQVDIVAGNGAVLIAGHGAAPGAVEVPPSPAFGIAASELTVVGGEASTATIALVGETNGLGGYGIGGALGAPFSIRVIGDGQTQRTGANVVIGASGRLAREAIDVDGQPIQIATSGNLNVRPAGVDTNGNVVARNDVPIQVDAGTACQNGNFCLPASWLREATNSAQGPAHIQAGQLIIGSQSHTGAITVDGSTVAGNLLRNITLQNEGTGSQGVVLNNIQHANLFEGRQFSVLSSGPVTKDGASLLFIDRFMVKASSVNLRLTGENSIRFGSQTFDVSDDYLTQSFFDTSIGTGATVGFDPAANGGVGQFNPVSITTNRVGLQGFIETFDGTTQGATMTLNAPIELGSSGFSLVLSTDGLFQNPGNATITSVGDGNWNIFSRSWIGANRGGLVGSGPVPNAYGCSTLACPGNINLQGSSGFRYAERPTLNVTPNAVQFTVGQPVPPIGFTVSGLVNGDTAQTALSGALSTTATPQSAPGTYPATAGTLASPLGYQFAIAGGSENTAVTVLSAGEPPVRPVVEAPFTPGNGLGRAYGFAILGAETNSEVNGRNLSRAQMCVAPGALRRQREAGEGTDFLGIEWSRVRSQPHLSNCLEVGDDNECAAF